MSDPESEAKVILLSTSPGKYGWEVRCGFRYQDELGPDEALWTVACLLMGKGEGYLKTEEQHAAYRAQWGPKRPLESWQKLLPAPEGGMQ